MDLNGGQNKEIKIIDDQMYVFLYFWGYIKIVSIIVSASDSRLLYDLTIYDKMLGQTCRKITGNLNVSPRIEFKVCIKKLNMGLAAGWFIILVIV